MTHIRTWYEAESAFNEVLDDCYPPLEIVGVTFWPSYILRDCDPGAYKEALLDWLAGEGIDSDELTGQMTVR